jgi:paraquat-inducible protein B
MPENDPRSVGEEGLPQPQVVARRGLHLSKVWIIPLVAVLVAMALFFQRLAREGPEVIITFKSVQGVEAGKTPIRYKDVVVGVVTALKFSPEFDTVEVTASITREAAPLMTEGAAFWIVRPRVALGEISGLGTLLSGNYIALERGAPDRPRRHFEGLEEARIVGAGEPGRRFLVHSHEALRIDPGLPIYHLGLQAGRVVSASIGREGRGVDLEIFVQAPYDRYVRPSTRFWNADGLDLRVAGGDISVRTESLAALLLGGLAFDNVRTGKDEAPAPAGSAFVLYRDRATALKPRDAHEPRFVLLFDEPVDGVQPGSPVKLLGVEAGEVTAVGLAYDRRSGRLRGRLEVSLALGQLLDRMPRESAGEESAQEVSQAQAVLRRMVTRQGLRAQLRTASLVTGQRYVAFDYFSRPSPANVEWSGERPELPVVPSVLPAFEDKLARLMDRLAALPLEDTVADARAMMQQARSALASADGLVRDVDKNALPGFVATMDDARHALESAQRMIDGASATLVGVDAPGQRELRAALQEMTRAAQAFRTLSDSIERHPESLLWGRDNRSSVP